MFVDTSLPSTTTQLTSTTPAQTTTTLRLAPVRDKSKHIPFELEDCKYRASSIKYILSQNPYFTVEKCYYFCT